MYKHTEKETETCKFASILNHLLENTEVIKVINTIAIFFEYWGMNRFHFMKLDNPNN